MKTKISSILLFIILIVLGGLYYYPSTQDSFFDLYPYNDTVSKTYKEFTTKNTKTLLVDGVKWKYYKGGQGEKTILFIHGMGGSYDIWWQQIQKFEKNYRVLSYSLPEEINSLKETAKGIQSILAQEKVDSFIAVGTSMGGYITQYLMNIWPERLEKAVLSNTFPPNDIILKENEKTAKIVPKLPEIVLAMFMDKKLKNTIVPSANNSKLLGAILASLPFSKKQFINRYAVATDQFSLNTTKTKQIPKLIFESDNDSLVHSQLRSLLKENYPEAVVHTFHNAGHFPYVNSSDEYNKILGAFLDIKN